MDTGTMNQIKNDFEEWSGGFSPESRYQITVYVDYALRDAVDPVEATNVLLRWMNSPDADDGAR